MNIAKPARHSNNEQNLYPTEVFEYPKVEHYTK